ncbi:MAG: DDE-type integrase/transposase/recombinase [Pseudonocardia sp.]|nr:DDE-type integrase/transposase/recombinase [Pseudonocardia sp.]
MLVSQKRNLSATRRFLTHTLEHDPNPSEMTTDKAAAYPRVLDELGPSDNSLIIAAWGHRRSPSDRPKRTGGSSNRPGVRTRW